MQHICKELLEDSLQSREIFSLWQEYEDGETMEAKFVKDLDKFELILQAYEYEKCKKKELFCHYFICVIYSITHKIF
jgi:putative hydrolase of HD superfamily